MGLILFPKVIRMSEKPLDNTQYVGITIKVAINTEGKKRNIRGLIIKTTLPHLTILMLAPSESQVDLNEHP